MLLPEAIDHTKTVGHARAWPKSPAWKKATTARPSQSSCLKVQEAGEMQAEFSERYLDGSAKSRLMPPPRCSAPRAPAICDYLLDLGGQITASLHVYSTGHLRADSYEPTGTYDTLQKNLGQDARMTLHQKAGLHETSLWRCGDCNFAAGSAHREPHSDSEAIRSGGEAYYFKQIGSVVMATEFAAAGQWGRDLSGSSFGSSRWRSGWS
ncbi:Pol [Symbiodinium sp. KB8]|nr:Pol [Symbiodinium sp. KB8]